MFTFPFFVSGARGQVLRVRVYSGFQQYVATFEPNKVVRPPTKQLLLPVDTCFFALHGSLGNVEP
jgi:hypothetical protein